MIFHQIPVKTISFPLLRNFCTDWTKIRRNSRYVYRILAVSRPGSGGILAGCLYNVCAAQEQLLQIAKKISIIRVKFQHNIVLIFQQFLWYDSLAKYGGWK